MYTIILEILRNSFPQMGWHCVFLPMWGHCFTSLPTECYQTFQIFFKHKSAVLICISYISETKYFFICLIAICVTTGFTLYPTVLLVFSLIISRSSSLLCFLNWEYYLSLIFFPVWYLSLLVVFVLFQFVFCFCGKMELNPGPSPS